MKLPTSMMRKSYRLTAAIAVAVAALMNASAYAAPSGVMGPKNPPAAPGKPAPDAFFLVHGNKMPLATYSGQPLMIWEVATWCGSCKAGLRAFAHHQALIDKSNLKVLVLRDYKNGGYPGITIGKFAGEVAPSLLKDAHFVFGDATKSLAAAYNPHHYVDIYQLIDAQRDIVTTSAAPSVTFKRIEAFLRPGQK